ncbi:MULTISPECIES: sugar porter family MFS transporter [Asticcacaulis]|uniref:sugar porter family MFS transporter n=1 Tax=Asticcacaulis TaxID=76890 RepID=UPI001AEB9EF6|nr:MULTISPECIES: sugar porter family MFS transporter [Asticcacaulis]MBP2159453.1 SP family xylose:H+ symportor-like MFS transporter [Asticcacaulis solisilvae]MDR6800720.1 SP family xylose:H+ symportor-like MFS transporter [Asticcacaulis sp. BE141]
MSATAKSVNMGLVMGLAIGAALGGLLFGYDTAVINGAVESIKHNFIDPRTALTELERNNLFGWATGMALLGCVVGSLIAGPLATALGRRVGMLVAAFLFFVSSILSGYPELGLAPIGGMGVDALNPFMVYRFIGGVAIGMASLISPLYIAEIAPAKQRGLLVTFQQLAIVGGILLVAVVNLYIQRMGGGDESWLHATGWRYMLASCALPAALFFLAAFMMPDTPRWYVIKGHEEKARKVLLSLNDAQETEATITEIKGTLTEHSGKLFSFGAGVIIVGILLSVFQQFVGINAVLYYSNIMFKNIGLDSDTAFLQTVIVMATNVLFTLVATFTVDSWGRKPLLILGGLIMAAAMIAMGFLFQTHSQGIGLLAAAMLYVAGFALSWGPVVWVMLSELFPNSIKGPAMAIAVAAQWISNFVVTWSFLIIDGDTKLNEIFNHGAAYYMYGIFSILAALFVWKFVPETKGKTLEAIESLWKKS